MRVIATKIPDIKLIEPAVYDDVRGFFMETWRDDWFRQHVSECSFVQDNHSKSCQGTLRGLHYQTVNVQGKLIRVTSGEMFDVAVDMRQSSTTFGQWVGVMLSSENRRQLWVPPGFAHGFYVLSEYAECVYRCTDYYNPSAEHGVSWDDPTLAINWPLIAGSAPLLSVKDSLAKSFEDAIVFS